MLEVTYPPPMKPGRHSAQIELNVNAPDGSEYTPYVVDVTGLVVDDVQTAPARFVGIVRSQEANDSGTMEPVAMEMDLYSLLPGHNLFVSGYELDPELPEHLRFSAEALEPDSRGYSARWRLRLEVRGPLPKPLVQGELTLFLSDPQTPEKRVPFVLHGR